MRQETKSDYPNVYRFVEVAFQTARVTGGEEREMTEHIHNSDKYISELSLIAEIDGQMVGYIMLSKTTVTNGENAYEALLLGPVCSQKELRNQGIGSQLIKKAISIAKNIGFTAVFLAGDRHYYSRFGFVPASEYGIKCQYEIPANLLDNIMALEIIPGALDGITGIVEL